MDDGAPGLLGKRLVLGVTGSIAAYKAVGLLRALVREGATVTVVLTKAATKFVNPLTFEVLSGRPTAVDLFEGRQEMQHLTVPEQADAIVIAPATANVLAKAAIGLADDLLSTMLLAARCPLVVAPAMDGDMWHHPTVVEHVRVLRGRGATILDPDEGPLASGRIGRGRMAEETAILAAIQDILVPRRDWRGQRLLVSAGPTQEPIDPVRFISNRSSGKMGYAVAEAAQSRGAQVILVSGPTSLQPPPGVEIVPVTTAEEMAKAMEAHLPWSTAVVMAAAVADFRPSSQASQKLKKRDPAWLTMTFEPTTDILGLLRERRGAQLFVGFAAETQHLEIHAKEKLIAKGLDLIVANDVTADGCGFGTETNSAILIDRHGRTRALPVMPKRQMADEILDTALDLLRVPRQSAPKHRDDRRP